MTADETLGRIDDTLEAWELGPDAMRSVPDAEPGAWEEPLQQLGLTVAQANANISTNARLIREAVALETISDEARELGRVTPWSPRDWQDAINAIGHRDDWERLKEFALSTGHGPRSLIEFVRSLETVAVAYTSPPPRGWLARLRRRDE